MRSTYDVFERYTGAGNQAAYTFSFKIEAKVQLLVVAYNSSGVEIQRVRGTNLSYLSGVTFDAVAGGGTVTLAANLPSGYTLLLLLANDEPTQDYEFKNKFDFTLERVEAALDFIVGSVQRTAYLGQRALRLNDFDSLDDFNPALPPGIAGAASLIPATNEDGDGWAPVDEWTPVADLAAAVTAAASALADAAAAAASEAAAAASAAAASASETNAAASEASVAADAASAAADAASALTSKNAAAASQTAAATSATNAATSATSASTSATNAATSATNAGNSATSAGNSATSASISAALAAASQAAAAISEANAAAAAGGVTPDVSGTRAAPINVVAGTGIVFSSNKYVNYHFVQGSGGAVDISANPQIAAGSVLGQRLILQGRSNTNTIKLEHGTGVVLAGGAGELYLFQDTIGQFIWDGTNWVQCE